MFCKNCGTPMKDGAKFCPKCGAANTDKAREIVKKRLEVLNDATD